MKLDDLLYLYYVSKFNSVTIAAETLHVSQPAISMGIKRLENELECKLTTRTYHGIALTRAGEEIAQKIDAIFDSLEEIHKISGMYSPNKTSQENDDFLYLQITAPEIITRLFPEEVIEDLCKNNILPDIKTTFAPLLSLDDVLRLDFGDVAIFYIDHKLFSSDLLPEHLGAETIYTSKLHFVVSGSNHYFDMYSSISYDEIFKYSLIYPHDINKTNITIADEVFAPLLNFGSPKIVMRSEDTNTIKKIVESTNLGTISFKGLSKASVNKAYNLREIPVNDSRKYSMVVLYEKKNGKKLAIRLLINSLKKLV